MVAAAEPQGRQGWQPPTKDPMWQLLQQNGHRRVGLSTKSLLLGETIKEQHPLGTNNGNLGLSHEARTYLMAFKQRHQRQCWAYQDQRVHVLQALWAGTDQQAPQTGERGDCPIHSGGTQWPTRQTPPWKRIPQTSGSFPPQTACTSGGPGPGTGKPKWPLWTWWGRKPPLEGLNASPQIHRGKGSLKQAITLSKNQRRMGKAVQEFKKKFCSFATLQAKSSKRRQVLEIAKNCSGGTPFPVDQELLVVVGTAIDSSGVKSGDQYVHELKLMHIESGFDWSAPLERQLFLVKKALRRHKGPEQRAIEVRLVDIPSEKWQTRSRVKGGHLYPVPSFAFASVWMLRAAEAFKVELDHLQLDRTNKEAKLFIPYSKMDQRGKGATRILVCHCKGECQVFCGWGISLMARSLTLESEGKNTPLFTWVSGKPATKDLMVKSWKSTVNKNMGGHSARRSGAMEYTRQGMDVQSVSFLGRWRSAAVFRYIEQALESMPANRTLFTTKDPLSWEGAEPMPVGSLTPLSQTVQEDPKASEVPLVDTMPEHPENAELWAISTGRTTKGMAHFVTRAAWGLDLNLWSTACGWHFA